MIGQGTREVAARRVDDRRVGPPAFRTRDSRGRDCRLLAVCLLATVALSAVVSSASATVLERLSIEEMARRADSVLVVKTGEPKGLWKSNGLGKGRSAIETQVDCVVVDVLKGAVKRGAIQRIHTLGGRVGGVTFEVEGLTTWAAGETCVVFLDPGGRVIGGRQGKLSLNGESVADGGQPLATIRGRIDRALGRKQSGVTTPPGAPGRGKTGTSLKRLSAGTTRIRLAGSDRLVDVKNVRVTSLGPTGQVAPRALSPVFFDDFEHNAGWGPGWNTLSGGAWWTWTPGFNSAWCMHPGQNEYYEPDEQYGIVAGPLDLAFANAARLEFDLYLDSKYGEGMVTPVVQEGSYLVTDEMWPFVTYWQDTSWTGSTDGGWEHMLVDLADFPSSDGTVSFVGKNDIWVGLAWTTASVTEAHSGAYIDNFKVSMGTLAIPVVSSITPGTASAGTNSKVTIAGSNFGTPKGQVYFTYKEGQEAACIEAPVTTWTGTQIVCTVPTAIIDDYAASAGSGPVYVVTAEGGRSSGTPFHVTFGYGGKKWTSIPVHYRINPSPLLGQASADAVKAAAGAWNAAGSAFSLVYDGPCSTTEVTQDFENDVFWTELDPGVIGIAGSWTYTGGSIAECDTGFNTDYEWGFNDPTKMDVKTIATHELGHWLSLRDLYCDNDQAKVMYGYGIEGMVKPPHAEDVAGIKWIYPPPPKVTSAGFSNPIAYSIASLLKTHMVAKIDQSNVRAKIVVKTSLGDWTIFDSDIPNTANVGYAFPDWDGKQPGTGKQAPYAASYDWTLTVTKNGRSSVKTGKILLSKVYFVRSATSGGPNVQLTHTGYLTGSSASPAAVNIYLSSSASSAGKLYMQVTGPSNYNQAPTNTPWTIGPGSPAPPTAKLNGTKGLKGTGIYTFSVKGTTGVTYAFSVIE